MENLIFVLAAAIILLSFMCLGFWRDAKAANKHCNESEKSCDALREELGKARAALSLVRVYPLPILNNPPKGIRAITPEARKKAGKGKGNQV